VNHDSSETCFFVDLNRRVCQSDGSGSCLLFSTGNGRIGKIVWSRIVKSSPCPGQGSEPVQAPKRSKDELCGSDESMIDDFTFIHKQRPRPPLTLAAAGGCNCGCGKRFWPDASFCCS
jgi:hypothetical protein